MTFTFWLIFNKDNYVTRAKVFYALVSDDKQLH
jgi:hypothetical protein